MAKDPTQRPTAGHVLTFCESQLSVAEQLEEGQSHFVVCVVVVCSFNLNVCSACWLESRSD